MSDYLAWWKKQVIWSQHEYQQHGYITIVSDSTPCIPYINDKEILLYWENLSIPELSPIIHATAITGLCRFLGLQIKFCKIMYFNAKN